MDRDAVSRRKFLSTLATSIAAAPFASAFSRTRASAASGAIPSPIVLDLSNPTYSSLATVGKFIKISDPNNSTRPMIVGRSSATAVVAYSSQCTFDGCELPIPASENGVMVCPCCGSIFDSNGTVIKGPASTNLTVYRAELGAATVTVLFGNEAIQQGGFNTISTTQVAVKVENDNIFISLPQNGYRWTVTILDMRGVVVFTAEARGGSLVRWSMKRPYGVYTVRAQSSRSLMFSHTLLAGI